MLVRHKHRRHRHRAPATICPDDMCAHWFYGRRGCGGPDCPTSWTWRVRRWLALLVAATLAAPAMIGAGVFVGGRPGAAAIGAGVLIFCAAAVLTLLGPQWTTKAAPQATSGDQRDRP